jgi:hypothetical protein
MENSHQQGLGFLENLVGQTEQEPRQPLIFFSPGTVAEKLS